MFYCSLARALTSCPDSGKSAKHGIMKKAMVGGALCVSMSETNPTIFMATQLAPHTSTCYQNILGQIVPQEKKQENVHFLGSVSDRMLIQDTIPLHYGSSR